VSPETPPSSNPRPYRSPSPGLGRWGPCPPIEEEGGGREEGGGGRGWWWREEEGGGGGGGRRGIRAVGID